MIYDVCTSEEALRTGCSDAGRKGRSLSLVIERMDKTGKKILATGNGKCNLTNQAIRRAVFHPVFIDPGRRRPRFMYWRILMPVIHWLFLNPWGFIQKRGTVMSIPCLSRRRQSAMYYAGNWRNTKQMW